MVVEGLQERPEDGFGGRFDGGIEIVGFGIEFVAANVEMTGKGSCAGKEVREKGCEERRDERRA